jgi:hypothetical protein
MVHHTADAATEYNGTKFIGSSPQLRTAWLPGGASPSESCQENALRDLTEDAIYSHWTRLVTGANKCGASGAQWHGRP